MRLLWLSNLIRHVGWTQRNGAISTVDRVPFGLANMGNTCHLNCVIQVLPSFSPSFPARSRLISLQTLVPVGQSRSCRSCGSARTDLHKVQAVLIRVWMLMYNPALCVLVVALGSRTALPATWLHFTLRSLNLLHRLCQLAHAS